jgi:hypothetical protein
MTLNNLIKRIGLKNFLLGISVVMTLVTLIPEFTNYFMQNTYLAKLYVITLSILWTCINKYLGIAFVLIFVYLYNFMNNNIENFETSVDENTTKEKKEIDKTEPAKINVVTSTTEKIDSDNNIDMGTNTLPSSQPSSDEKPVNNKSTETKKNMAVEGFDLQSTENAIKRGKQSNSIPVDQLVSKSTDDNISPYEDSEFSEGFSIF